MNITRAEIVDLILMVCELQERFPHYPKAEDNLMYASLGEIADKLRVIKDRLK